MASSLGKMLGLLDLFTEETPAWTADGICAQLRLTPSSGYRYIRELCAAGLLTRITGGSYVLGVRIIELEFVMQRADPVARVGRPILKQLAATTGCDAMLSNFYGLHIINVLHERGVEQLEVSYLRGRQHPLFRGAVAKAILPFLKRPLLVRIYEEHSTEIAEAHLGESWLEFWRGLQAIKRQGFSASAGELDAQVSGLGVPYFQNGAVLGSISLAYSSARGRLLNQQALVEGLQESSRALTEAIEALAPGAGARR